MRAEIHQINERLPRVTSPPLSPVDQRRYDEALVRRRAEGGEAAA